MGGLYRLDVAESRYGNQIPPLPTIFERPFKIEKTTFVVKYMSGMTHLIGQIFACVLV